MGYPFILFDRPGAAALRQQVRPEHKAYLDAVVDRIAFAVHACLNLWPQRAGFAS